MHDRYYMHEEARLAAERLIFITGPARSGTTLMGKLIHSFEGVEYLFEPPMVAALLPLVKDMDDCQFRLLWEALVYEGILMGQVTGRGFNLNPNDDSCIYSDFEPAEVQERLEKAWRKEDAVEIARHRRLAIKFPDVTPFLPELKELYPDMKVLSMVRGAQSVINSLLRKEWLTDENLLHRTRIWPSKSQTDMTIPFWLDLKDRDRWISMRPVERAAVYYCCVMEPLLDMQDVILIAYDRLLAKPSQTISRIEGTLEVHTTAKTDEILKTLHPATMPDAAWLDQLPSELKERVERVEHSLAGVLS